MPTRMQGLSTRLMNGIGDWLDFNAGEVGWILLLIGLVVFLAYLTKSAPGLL